jgi:hypothetical protein
MEVPLLRAQQFRSDILCLYRASEKKPHFYSIIEIKGNRAISIQDLSQLIGYMKTFAASKGIPFNATKVTFVPNVIYDLMFYTTERGPICISAKTSLRERYKQADLEAIALKYVHRKALSYLVTLEENEAKSVKAKIISGDVIGLDNVVVATSKEFDKLVIELRGYRASEPPTVKVIESNQIITAAKVKALK